MGYKIILDPSKDKFGKGEKPFTVKLCRTKEEADHLVESMYRNKHFDCAYEYYVEKLTIDDLKNYVAKNIREDMFGYKYVLMPSDFEITAEEKKEVKKYFPDILIFNMGEQNKKEN